MNQETAVLQWLKKGATITNTEAARELGITRLGSVINRLRGKGHDIETIMCEGKDRFGSPCRYARYRLRQ